MGALDETRKHYEAYLAISQNLVAKDPANPRWRNENSDSYSNLGNIKEAQGDLKGALEEYSKALK